jgi:hypothetical protein
MKKICFQFIIFLVVLGGCKTTKQLTRKSHEDDTKIAPIEETSTPALDYHDQTTWLLGYFNTELLTHYPYSTWYLKGYNEYQIKTEALTSLLDINKEGITIKVVMGIWCPDSRREVPRFMKILNAWQFPDSRVTFIGVDDAKLSPVGEYSGLNIQRVPTFILYKNNIEAGRIIENPAASLEQDMVNILTGMNNNK